MVSRFPHQTLSSHTTPSSFRTIGDSTASDPQVTLIVVPRERFQFARESLESLYEHTDYSFELIYVDNHSPAQLRDYLDEQAQKRGFQLMRSNRFLSPNAARNLGLRYVRSKYVVFVDNDVIFSQGWLRALVNCAEETAATVVGSLVCQYRPVHEIIHCAGGEYMPPEELALFLKGEPTVPQIPGEQGKWQVNEKTYHQNRSLAELRNQLKREPTGFVEFHSMLVRTEIFERIGWLDEQFSCTKEYLDFCMLVARAGGSIYLEPASIVTFLTHPPAPPLEWTDLPYFMLRWSDAWERASLLHFQEKWNLAESSYFQKRYKKLGWRRRQELIKPLVEQLGFANDADRKRFEKRLVALEKRLNRYLSDRHARLTRRRTEQNSIAAANAGMNHFLEEPALASASSLSAQIHLL